MKQLRNKRGDGYIFPCIMIVVVCMMLSVFIFFAGAVNLVRITKENTKLVLDSYVMKNQSLFTTRLNKGMISQRHWIKMCI